jgi:hypothetical protein
VLAGNIDAVDQIGQRSLAARGDIAFKPCQKASSRLTLVLCPASTIERFTTGDFMALLL